MHATLDTVKLGDFFFHEFRLSMLKEARKNGQTIGNGVTEISGASLLDQCRPLTYRNLTISQSFLWHYDQLHRETERFNLNWPEIHWWFVCKWMEACDSQDDDGLKAAYDAMGAFCREIRDGCDDMRHKKVGGVNAFARR